MDQNEPQIIDMDEQTKLANKFASLEVAIIPKLMEIARAQAIARERTAEVLPLLEQIQSILSERGDKHPKNSKTELPRWKEWWEHMRAVSGIRYTLRALQKIFAKLRARDAAESSRNGTEGKENRRGGNKALANLSPGDWDSVARKVSSASGKSIKRGLDGLGEQAAADFMEKLVTWLLHEHYKYDPDKGVFRIAIRYSSTVKKEPEANSPARLFEK